MDHGYSWRGCIFSERYTAAMRSTRSFELLLASCAAGLTYWHQLETSQLLWAAPLLSQNRVVFHLLLSRTWHPLCHLCGIMNLFFLNLFLMIQRCSSLSVLG